MAPTPKITEETIEKFNQLCDEGLTQEMASKQLGLGRESIRKASERLSIPIPSKIRNRIRNAVLERLDEIIHSSEGQKYWADEFNTSQAYISRLFKELDVTKKQRGTRTGDHKTNKIADARKVIGYIAENGGNVINAIKQLGLNISQPQYIRDFGKECGFNFHDYLFAWRTYGNWLTIPGPIRRLKPPQNIMVPAVCTSCGNIKEMNMTNAKTGRTHSCLSCAAGQGRRFNVKDTSTGEVFKSVMAFVKAKGLKTKYQTIRVKLISKGVYTIDGVDYELIKLD